MSEISTATNEGSILEPGHALDTITRAARDGAADAREMANRVWASTSLFVCRFVYTTSYTISYGVVFPSTLIARAVPVDNAAVHGLIDGARAAREKAQLFKASPIPGPSGE